MSVRKNKPTERVVKMSNSNSVVKPKYKAGDVVIALESLTNLLTQGKEYIVGNVAYGCQLLLVETDDGNTNELYAWRFKLKEEENSVATDEVMYRQLSSGYIFNLLFKGETQCVLKRQCDGTEISVHVENLYPPLFRQCTKEDVKAIAKQQKKNEDLGVLANVTDEIRKFLNDNYVICHASVNRDTKGLVEYTIMLGESL